MDTNVVLFYLLWTIFAKGRVLVVFWSLHFSVWASTGHFQLPTAVHRHHSPSPSWVFVSSQSQRNKMAEERAHTTLIPFPPPSEMPWGTSKLDQGGVNPGAWRNLSSLSFTLPLTPYTASLSEEFHSSLFLTDRLALAQRLPARGTRRWAGVKHKVLWHYVNSTVACIHGNTNTASLF